MATYHIDQIDQKILSFLVNNASAVFLEPLFIRESKDWKPTESSQDQGCS